MNLNNFIFFLLIICAGISCKKECDDPNVVDSINLTELPPATMTGANTMGCLINGQVWLPLKENFLGQLVYDISFTVTGPSEGGGVFIQARRQYNDHFDSMNITTPPFLEAGIYPYLFSSHRYIDDTSDCGYFDLDTTFNNYIEIIRIDYEEEIVSGLYQMRVVNEECDTLTITEGRFDLSP